MGLQACQSRKFEAQLASRTDSDANAQDNQRLPPYTDFCSLNKKQHVASQNPAGFPEFWSRKDIEEKISEWKALVSRDSGEQLKPEFSAQKSADKPNKASVILTAYGTAYKEMTAERDRERCKAPRLPGGAQDDVTTSPMVADESTSEGKLVNMVNHALADLMTRNIVNISKGCLLASQTSSGYNAEPENERWEFCDLYFDTASKEFNGSYNAMTVAMSSTMIYLTSHISGSLAALPFLDRLWVGGGDDYEWPARGKRAQATREEIWKQRIKFIREKYKEKYDQFNGFLSLNLDTVANALAKDQQIKSTSIPNLSSAIKKKAPVLTLVIGKIFESVRTESFEIGIGMASALANDSGARQVVSVSMPSENGLPQIHPFLIPKPLGKGNESFYYEIRESQPVFGKELLALDWVKSARALTWKHRIDVESWPSRRVFRALGAIGYEEGFDPARAKTSSLFTSFIENIASCFDKGVRGHLEEKAREIGIDTSSWSSESSLLRNLAKKEVRERDGNDAFAPSDGQNRACEVPEGE